ncbi:MAG TPA: thermonuclease family protein [Gaiellales bacterium]|jgi:micrococcal nuclease|nr:thermonuclease family protein [Gaiellales bacterium]
MRSIPIRIGVLAAVAAVAGVVWVHGSAAPPFTAGTVVRVVDGDTIIVRGPSGRTEDVRLIGIDTPETVDPRRPVGCFGPEASAYAKHLLGGRRVLLRYDRELHDRYGRFLAYVWLPGRSGLFVNARLVELGFARAFPFPPNTAHEPLFAALERRAAIAGRGLWSACG